MVMANPRDVFGIIRSKNKNDRVDAETNEDRVIESSFFVGSQNREIALEMGVSEGWVSQIRRRALSRLRTRLT